MGTISAMGSPLLVMQTLFFFVLTSSKTDKQVALNFDTDKVSIVSSILAHSQLTIVILWRSLRVVNRVERTTGFTQG
jgi:hypothetical protein